MPQATTWYDIENVPQPFAGSRNPAVATLSEQPHLVWHSQGQIQHSYRTEKGWSNPRNIAYGTQPCIAIGKDGILHCVYANEFAGNSEIFYVHCKREQWSAAELVSRTSGASADPVLAVDENGLVHIAWSDTTPGYSTIYYGQRAGLFFTSQPIPNGRGSKPSLAILPGDTACLAWQDQDVRTGYYDIYFSQADAESWSPPAAISDSSNAHSFMPSLAIGTTNAPQIAWEEERDGLFAIYHCERLPNGWTVPSEVSVPSGQDCRVPQLRTTNTGFVQLVWLEGNAIKHRSRPPDAGTPWRQPETVDGAGTTVEDVAVAITTSGRTHLAWTTTEPDGPGCLRYSQRTPILSQTIHIPSYFR